MMKHHQFFRGLTCAHTLHWDIESRSPADLKKVGVYVYASNPATEIICLSYAVDDGAVKTWRPGDPVPDEFKEAATNPSWTSAAHNSAFETTMAQFILHPRHGFPLIPVERQRCTQAMSLALGLPAKLNKLADALEQVNRKDMAGERLMHMMSKPRKPRTYEDPNGVYWHDEPDKVQRLIAYNVQDIEAEREADGRLLQLSDAEQAIWLLSNKINARGFHVDRDFALAARKIAREAAPELNDELTAVTDGVVTSINQVAKLKTWLHSQGCTTTKLDVDTIEKLLEGEELTTPARRALELRRDGAQAAVKKIDALLARAGSDDRIRGAFRYHGASTGRWAGEGYQPQNLKRPETEDLGAAIAAVATGDYAHVKSLYPKPLAIVGDCSRSMLTAALGYILIGADFSAIESRVLAWLAGETWKLHAYCKFDVSHDPRDEVYCINACKIYHVPEGTYDKKSPERKVGKTCDLAFGFMGGLGAFRKFEPDQFSDAEVEIFKNEWRNAHPKTRQFWYDIDRAAITAVRKRGEVIRCGMIALQCDGAFLQIRLPSGRRLSYPFPRIVKDDRGNSRVLFADNGAGRFSDCRGGDGAYGGTWTENIVSGIARDLLVEAMLRVEVAGYPITLTVHDEIVAEVPVGFGSEEEFADLMTQKPVWAGELPIAAETWSGPRYVK
jgi:DNA polymerase bacteriophage-type